jgi:quercetin dioxygenase-like cupin family protein
MLNPKHIQPSNLTNDGKTRSYVYTFAPGEGLLEHAHEYAHDTIVDSGELTVAIDGALRTMKAGDRLTMPAGSVHGCIAATPCACRQVHPEAELELYDPDLATTWAELSAELAPAPIEIA